ncbi:hypothetical protein L917_17807, partial [Phytophthora nicotianae]
MSGLSASELPPEALHAVDTVEYFYRAYVCATAEGIAAPSSLVLTAVPTLTSPWRASALNSALQAAVAATWNRAISGSVCTESLKAQGSTDCPRLQLRDHHLGSKGVYIYGDLSPAHSRGHDRLAGVLSGNDVGHTAKSWPPLPRFTLTAPLLLSMVLTQICCVMATLYGGSKAFSALTCRKLRLRTHIRGYLKD